MPRPLARALRLVVLRRAPRALDDDALRMISDEAWTDSALAPLRGAEDVRAFVCRLAEAHARLHAVGPMRPLLRR